LRDINIKTGTSTRGANKYTDILNPPIVRKISYREFMSMSNSYFGAIASEQEGKHPILANYLLCLSRYAHEVYTLSTGNEEVYSGLSGFGLPNADVITKDPEFLQLLVNATKEAKTMSGSQASVPPVQVEDADDKMPDPFVSSSSNSRSSSAAKKEPREKKTEKTDGKAKKKETKSKITDKKSTTTKGR